MDKCKNHPLRFAAGRCKRCHTPLCMECKIAVEEGIFCSDACVEQFRSFQSRMSSIGSATRSRFSLIGFIKSTIIAAVLIVVIFVALAFWLKTTDPKEMLVKLKDQISLIM